ncbi:MAG: hypothetical protein HKN60_08720 [Rhizobiales bacterium]|nr:hypothetical protein [Hyphomicrobiales bacterium]
MNQEEASERLVEQRVRNRIMEEVWGLSRGDSGVVETGATEWSESFFDWFPYEGEPDGYPAMTTEEAVVVRDVCTLMQQAVAELDHSNHPSVEDLIATGWPERVAPVAQRALDLMLARGRFSEDVEEAEPSAPAAWP